jgi:serine/threonine protein kinase
MADDLVNGTEDAAQDDAPSDPRIPSYRVEGQLGRGGMAVVYRAVDERLGRMVALKVLAPALAGDDAFRQRFVRESRTAAAVDHPHILPIYETGEAGGVLYIAMRYVPGGDVHQLVGRTGRLAPARVAAIISATASALDAAHAAGLVHRDVKPANMLLDARPGHPDHVYLSDFGLTKSWPGSAALTGSGMFLGTPNYSAPEQIDSKPVDGRTDQYALACSAYELLAGQPPFQRDDATAVIWAHMSAPPPLLTELRPELPAEVNGVFARALAKVPAGRPARLGPSQRWHRRTSEHPDPSPAAYPCSRVPGEFELRFAAPGLLGDLLSRLVQQRQRSARLLRRARPRHQQSMRRAFHQPPEIRHRLRLPALWRRRSRTLLSPCCQYQTCGGKLERDRRHRANPRDRLCAMDRHRAAGKRHLGNRNRRRLLLDSVLGGSAAGRVPVRLG